MKKIPFIVLGLVLLAAIGLIVLQANMPTPKLTVHAASHAVTNTAGWALVGSEQSWPVSEFAITNTGRATAHWEAYLHFKDDERGWTDSSTSIFQVPAGVLAAGESASITMGVPPDPHATWALIINYRPDKSPVEKRLDAWLKPVPRLRNLLPNSRDHFASDTWHMGTNVTTDH